ncbi:MAG: sensor histidine kinase [Deltaproteobacteria bacterium]
MTTPAPPILYVDDESANRLIFERTFGKTFEVLTVETAELALELLATRPISVLIADQRLPGMLGTDLLAIVKERHPRIVRMVLTAYSDFEVVMKALNEGLTSRYILKPWSRDVLREILTWGQDVHRLQGYAEEMQLRLLEADRLSTLGTLLASIAHDIRNPLSYLKVYVDSLDQTVDAFTGFVGAIGKTPSLAPALKLPEAAPALDELEELPKILADLRTGFEQLFGLLQGIQQQARRPAGPTEPTEPSMVIEHAVRLVKGAVTAQGGHLEWEIAKGLPPVVLSSVELSQILLNLLTNAAHALEGVTSERRIRVTAELDGAGLRLRVSDTGRGMAPEVRDRAFEEFFTTKAQGVGTGLGLSNCRRLVQTAGGRIAIESELGKGTSVTCWLPSVVAVDAASAA